MNYCVYLTTYSGNKLPPFYIGSSSIKLIESGYLGSVSSKQYKHLWKSEICTNRHLFKNFIISVHKTREEAFQKEISLQKSLNVVKNSLYANKSVAVKNGCHGMHVVGEQNPNYGKRWSQEQKDAQSLKMKQAHAEGKLKSFPIKHGKDNGRFGDSRAAYINPDTLHQIFVLPNDDILNSGDYITLSSYTGNNPQKISKTKLSNPSLKKFVSVTIKEPTGIIVTLTQFEYSKYLNDRKLNNFLRIASPTKSVKGYFLLEAIPNPLCKCNYSKTMNAVNQISESMLYKIR